MAWVVYQTRERKNHSPFQTAITKHRENTKTKTIQTECRHKIWRHCSMPLGEQTAQRHLTQNLPSVPAPWLPMRVTTSHCYWEHPQWLGSDEWPVDNTDKKWPESHEQHGQFNAGPGLPTNSCPCVNKVRARRSPWSNWQTTTHITSTSKDCQAEIQICWTAMVLQVTSGSKMLYTSRKYIRGGKKNEIYLLENLLSISLQLCM